MAVMIIEVADGEFVEVPVVGRRTITAKQFVGMLENMLLRCDGAVTEQTTVGELIKRLKS